MDKVVHFEIPADDKGMPQEIGAINGGMMKRQKPVTSPIITIGVEDIEDSMNKVKKMGGEIVRGEKNKRI